MNIMVFVNTTVSPSEVSFFKESCNIGGIVDMGVATLDKISHPAVTVASRN